MGWVPLAFLALAVIVDIRYLAFFAASGVLGIGGELLVSVAWRRFFDEPIDHGAWRGHRIDRDAFTGAIRTWYRMMGWDDDARPTYETLVDHHLEWVVDEGYLPNSILAETGAFHS